MKKKKQNEDFKQAKRTIQKTIKRYRYKSDDGGASVFLFVLLMLSIFTIFHGGYSQNIYEIISGGIVLVFLYFGLR